MAVREVEAICSLPSCCRWDDYGLSTLVLVLVLVLGSAVVLM
jgi:hypothetical protein